MKKLALLVGTTLLISSTTFADEISKGKELFSSAGCSGCHQVSIDTVGPSLEAIANAYKDKEELKDFLKGKSKAKIKPEMFPIMIPNLNLTKNMQEKDLEALVKFIMSFKDKEKNKEKKAK